MKVLLIPILMKVALKKYSAVLFHCLGVSLKDCTLQPSQAIPTTQTLIKSKSQMSYPTNSFLYTISKKLDQPTQTLPNKKILAETPKP